MPHATSCAYGTIEASINYFKEPESGEYGVQRANTLGYKRQKGDSRRVEVNDIRGYEDDFKLDTSGFQLVKGFEVPYETWEDDAKIRQDVYPEAKELLKKTTGCTYVSVFSHILRRDPWQKVLDLPQDLPDDTIVKLSHPALNAHVDQTYRGAKGILNNVPDASELAPKSHSRWAIINIWRPLKPVTREPLAVCDARSVAESDLREVTFRTDMDSPRGKKGPHYLLTHIWGLKYSPEHKWYRPSNMTPGECLLIKCFDTKLDGRARRAPHSAIQTTSDHGPPRESIEIRCLVFWEDQPHVDGEEQYICSGEDEWIPAEELSALVVLD